jgi:hypothetical protein
MKYSGFAATMAIAASIAVIGLSPTSALAEGSGTENSGSKGSGSLYKVVPSWPKILPNKWLIGQVGGIAVDRHDNIWILQRARTLTSDEAGATDATAVGPNGPINDLGQPRPYGPIAQCCLPAPAVMQFDPKGKLLQAWGGPADPGFLGPHDAGAPGCDPAEGCQWPAGEHGIYVDKNDNVYIAGNGNGDGTIDDVPAPWAGTHGADSMVLKFSKNGVFLNQVGTPGRTMADSNDTAGCQNGTPCPYLPADSEVDHSTSELYIADGYGNHRVLVVDADTGLYKRHWGAYGQNPVDDTPSGPYALDRDAGVKAPNFRNPVHCVRIVGDLVYVCDRVNDRIQVFDKRTAGSEECSNPNKEEGVCGFVKEVYVAPETLSNGSTWDVDTSPDKGRTCLFNPDGTNQYVWVLGRKDLDILTRFGRNGRNAGQFHWVHNLATDSDGNIYTAEVDTGKRAQKFAPNWSASCKDEAARYAHQLNNDGGDDGHNSGK